MLHIFLALSFSFHSIYSPSIYFIDFSNKPTLTFYTNYWTQLAINSRSAIQQAATSGNVVDYIMTIGGTLHSVQDFYTHRYCFCYFCFILFYFLTIFSNWVDFYYRTECDCYRPETWLSVVHQSNGDLNTFLENQAAVHTCNLLIYLLLFKNTHHDVQIHMEIVTRIAGIVLELNYCTEPHVLESTKILTWDPTGSQVTLLPFLQL